jgi:hypothetical protein
MKDATYWRKTLEENMNDPDALSRNKVELAGLVFYANEQYAILKSAWAVFYIFNRHPTNEKPLTVDHMNALWICTADGAKQEKIKRFLEGANAVLDAITSRLVGLHMEQKLENSKL